MNVMAPCPCGFTGGSPNAVIPDWRIVYRNDSGSVISNDTIDGDYILLRRINGLQWKADITSGILNAPNSKLIVGPVNMTLNQSSYQCMFTIIREGGLETVMSSEGTMTVLGKISYMHCNNTLTNCNQQIHHLLLSMWMKPALHQLTYH